MCVAFVFLFCHVPYQRHRISEQVVNITSGITDVTKQTMSFVCIRRTSTNSAPLLQRARKKNNNLLTGANRQVHLNY